MNNRFNRWTLALAAALAPALAAAQSTRLPAAPAAAVPSSLQQALEQAMARQDVALAELDAEAARLRQVQANAAFYPTLSLGVNALSTKSYDRFSGTIASATLPSGPVTVQVERDVPRYEVTPALELRYRLYSGGYDSAALEHSRLYTQVAELELGIARRDVVRQVAGAYFNAWKAQLRHQQSLRWTALAERKLERARQRRGEGTLSEVDFRGEELALAQQRILQQQLALELAGRRSEYLAALGRAPAEAGSGFDGAFPGTPGEEVAAALKAIEQQLESRRSALEIEAARQRLTMAKADHMPQLNLFAQYTGVGRGNDSLASSSGHINRRDFVVGVKMSMVLFDGHATSARVRERAVELESRKIRSEKAALAASHAASSARQSVYQAQAELDLAARKAELARSRQRVAEARQQVGRDSPLELATAEAEVRDADSELLVRQIDLALARIDEAHALSTTDLAAHP